MVILSQGEEKPFCFHPEISKNTEYQLIQLTPDLQKEFEKNESLHLTLKGVDEDLVVLCSDNNTYDVKFADTSNSVLITSMEPETNSIRVDVIVSNHLELKPNKPRLVRVREMLEDSVYNGELKENNVTKLYTISALYEAVQASEKEIRDELRKLHAFELNGYWRLLNRVFAEETNELILAAYQLIIDAEEKENNAQNAQKRFPFRALCENLAEHNVPEPVLLHCLKAFATIYEKDNNVSIIEENKMDIDDNRELFFELDVEKVFFVKGMDLFALKDKWEYETFMETWFDNVNLIPDVSINNLDISLLKGEYFIIEEGGNKIVQRFSKASLDLDPKKRVHELFHEKSVWSLDEITPYMMDVADKGKFEPFLVKYGRCYIKNGVKYYKSKW